ncbi:uncharacterized protein LOC116287790 [Actinia tenebrosa]|uniref:Uncharacterized protein LOC116287790 n=1 Tax=Actinia tenebrosa TaxID=6105 RepID=A0A6P8HCT9_ACTTE|nr:uncharacterized protein LOC116287790 [Actinia tenebrosa]
MSQMSRVKDFVLQTFTPDSDDAVVDNNKNHRKIFAEKTGIFWSIIRQAFYAVSFLSHFSLSLSFLCFFVTALSLGINCALEITLEMISPTGDSSIHKKNFYSACLFVILVCAIINASFILSLFWEVVCAVLYKSSIKYTLIKIVIFFAVLISAGIWSGVSSTAKSGFVNFLSDCLIVSWFAAFVLSILSSLFLLIYLYKESSLDMPFHQIAYIFCCSLVILLFSILSPISFKLAGASTGGALAFAFLFPFYTYCLILYLLVRGKKETESGKVFVVQKRVFIIVAAVYLVVITLAANANISCGQECQLGHPVKEINLLYHKLVKPVSSGYPICEKKWSRLELGITDMAFLADTAYKIDTNGNKTIIRDLIEAYFQNPKFYWDVEAVNPKKPMFYHIREASSRVNVVSIRGTNDARDWFENFKIWNEIAVFQMISVALPVQHLPFEFVAFFISKSACLDYLFQRSKYHYYFQALEEYVKDKTTNSTEEFFLVGHSLGGGLAKIIGSRNKVQAIAISSPGEIYNHVKFGYTLEDVQQFTTTVRAQNDIVTWIDRSGGLVQYVECDNSAFLKCHNIRNTYCELKEKCHVTSTIPCPSDKPKEIFERLFIKKWQR